MLAGIVLLLATFAHAQDSQFLFDPNGNLFVQQAATTTPPQILGQPQNRIVALGEAAAFSVVAANTRSLAYQWHFNGTNISGAINDGVILQNVSTTNEGEYRVVLTNPSGSVTSAPALLMIDSDADGVPDSWELTYFGNLTNSATTDFDGDGSSNLQEFLNGTDPASSNSVRFRLTVLVDSGSVLKSPDQASYTNGESVTLTATAFPGGEPFHAWVGDIVTRSNPVTLVMTNNKTIHARFTPIDFIWTNLASSDWNSATNWTPNLVPGSNDSVVITSGNTITLNTAADCADFTLGDTGSGPILTGSGTLTVRGNFLWTQGTMSGSGRTVIEAGATLNIANPSGKGASLTTRTLENGGTVFWTGGGDFSMISGAVITNRAGALFHVQNAATLSAGAGRFDNAGTFRKSADTGTLTVANGVNFNNSGAVEIQTGTLLCNGSFTNTGAVMLSPGTTNRLVGGGSASGTFTASAGALVEWTTGTFLLNPGAQLNGTGLYRVSPSTVTANANLVIENLDLFGGTLNGTGAVTIASAMNWTGGTMSGSGRTIIAAGVTLNAAIPSSATLTTRTLENGGTVLWTGAGFISLSSGAVITNRAGALFHVQNAVALGGGAANGRFDNAGTFRKSASAGTTTVSGGVTFNNSGAVEIQTGTLLCSGSFTNTGAVTLSPGSTNRLVGGGSASGTFTAPASALVEWTVGTFLLNPGAQLNGTGLYRVSPSTVTANANLVIENLDLLGGTLGGTGAVTIASAMNWTGGTMSGSGRTIISAGVTLNAAIPFSVGLTTRTLENGGTFLWSGAGFIGVNGGAVITNRAGALFHVQNATGLGEFGANGRLDNAGTFRKSLNAGTTTIASGISFNNSGTVEIQTGTLLCNSGFTNNGAVNLSAGATNRIANGGSGGGTFSAPATALVEWTGGTVTLNPGAQLNGSGLYRINGGTVTANANLNVENLEVISSSSTWGGTGAVTIGGVMNWTAGSMSGTGRTIIAPGATLNAAIPSQVNLVTRTLENGGTVLWTNGTIALNGSLITNRPGALFHALGAGLLGNLGGSPRFNNAGTFRKSLNTGITTIGSGVNVTNSGTVDLRSGILAANGGYASTSNALLNCALGGTTPGTGYGRLQVAGTVTLNGALSVDLINGFVPATNDTFTVLTAGTRNGAFGNFSYPSNLVTMQLSNTTTSVIVRVTDVLTVTQPILLQPELSGTNIRLIWTAISNASYRLEFNPDLGPSNWNAIAGDVIGISNTASRLDALTPSNRFYRVRVLP